MICLTHKIPDRLLYTPYTPAAEAVRETAETSMPKSLETLPDDVVDSGEESSNLLDACDAILPLEFPNITEPNK